MRPLHAARWSLGVTLALAAASPATAEDTIRKHRFTFDLGGSDNGGYVLFGWTSPLRVGLYARLFPLLDDAPDAKANSFVAEESAGEVGIVVRANRWLTVGAGYAYYERIVTEYGDYLFFAPVTLGTETTDDDKGVGAIAMFALPSPNKRVACSLSVSISPAGTGAAIGIVFGP